MKTRHLGLIAGLFSALSVGDAGAANPNYNLCFNPSNANWHAVTVDGNVDNDGDWINAFQYIFDNGTNSPDVAVRAKSDGGKLFFGVEVKNDSTLDDMDAIVLAFATGPNTYAHLVVYPMHQGAGAVTNAPPREVDFFHGKIITVNSQPQWQWNQDAVNPAWLTARSKSVSGAPNSWTTEISFPISQIFPAVPAAPFAFYMNVVRADTSDEANPVARQFPWPRHDSDSTVDTDIIDDIKNLPMPDAWGSGKLNGNSCGGVYINFTDIHTNNADPTLISVEQPNVFQTNVHNTSIDANGNPKAANAVRVTFSYSDYGLYANNGPWNQIPAPSNPTAPQDLPANSTTLFQTGGWTAPLTMANHHWCIQAALSSTSNDTTFLNRATWNNMHVDHGSTLVANAVADGGGLPPPPPGKNSYTFRIEAYPSLQFAFADGTLPAISRGTLTTQHTVLFHAAYYRGRYINIQGVKFQLVDGVSSYGVVVQHPLPAAVQQAWEQRHANLLEVKKRIFSTETLPSNDHVAFPAALQRTIAVARLNQQLAADPEKPSAKEWAWNTPQLKLLKQGGHTFTLEVPKGGKVPLVTTVSYTEGGAPNGGGQPTKTCATCNFSSGPEAAGTFVFVCGVFLLVSRRRHRSRAKRPAR